MPGARRRALPRLQPRLRVSTQPRGASRAAGSSERGAFGQSEDEALGALNEATTGREDARTLEGASSATQAAQHAQATATST
eukprot:7589541-Pyramimonas_sp.AAC.1